MTATCVTDDRFLRRFWAKVRIDPRPGRCWEWTATRNQSGYGRIMTMIDGRWRNTIASRVAWEMFFGPIPAGLCVRHVCDNAACVLPDHLRLGTHADNMRDKRDRDRAPHGDGHHGARLTSSRVRHMREVYDAAGDIPMTHFAEKYGVSQGAVFAALTGKTWVRAGGPIAVPKERQVTEPPPEKRCRKCGEMKPVTDFAKNGAYRRADCKPCLAEQVRRIRNPEPVVQAFLLERQRDGYVLRQLAVPEGMLEELTANVDAPNIRAIVQHRLEQRIFAAANSGRG